MSAFLELRSVAKSFGEVHVLSDVSAAVEEGETLVLLGPSGSGKTTLLRLIAGFERPDQGSVRLAKEDLTELPTARRNFGMVFQHYALFPHLTVAENVGFGLVARGQKESAESRVEAMLELVELSGFGTRTIDELSGGQQQRVALARALAPRPRLLLLDEPLSNLDPSLRERTRRQIRSTVQRVGLTAVWVTHEQEEAFEVGDRVAVLNGGRLEQLGTPLELYAEPETPFVAEFVGRAGWIRCRAEGDGMATLIDSDLRWPVAADVQGSGTLLVRPEDLRWAEPAEVEERRTLPATVLRERFTGSLSLYTVELGDGSELEIAGRPHSARPGETLAVVRATDTPARFFASTPEEQR